MLVSRWTESLDPRSRLILSFTFAVLSLTVDEILPLIVVFGLSCAVALVFHVRWSALLRRAAGFGSIFLFVAIIQSLFGDGGRPILKAGEMIILSDYGLKMGVLGLLRLLTILEGGLFLAQVRTQEMMLGLMKLGFPGELALASALGASFVPRFAQEFGDALENLRMRGVVIQGLGPLQRIRLYLRLLKPVLGLTLRETREVSDILQLRGFRASRRRTSIRQLKFSGLDYLMTAFSVLALLFGFLFFS